MTEQDRSTRYANAEDRARAGRYEEREADWRQGAVVYQVMVDRFAPPADLDARRHLYEAPKRLHAWDETPTKGEYVEDVRLWSHEIDFWGGDLAGLRDRLDHVADLGADVLYLNPICEASTNHGYDAIDYLRIAPWLGSREDVTRLADDLHGRGMRLVLDGVFNHVGRANPIFRAAEADPASPYRDWFEFGERFPGGVRAWALAESLPELVHENPAVTDYLWTRPNSVVRSYLRDGVDGWRLDVASDLGFRFLEDLTRAAHAEKPGSLTVGEVSAYAPEWLGPLDGLLHWNLRRVLVELANGRLSARHAQRILARVYADADYEHMLRSWLFVDNHDTARLPDAVPDPAAQRLARVLQHTLPGSPVVYYGSEVGMTGGDDPEMRGPMRWDLLTPDNPWLVLTRRLVELRRTRRALRVGDLRWLDTDELIGFERSTDRVADAVVVLANPGDEPVTELVQLVDSKLMHVLVDALGSGARLHPVQGMVEVELEPHGVLVLTPRTAEPGGYEPFKRVQ
ncbi:cyclomaltodextrinase [Salana multivorans]|uniref:Alpha-amylase n=1 Tax=Salana multivorans TaxID=120377 RepID=A0A3N2D1A2_9MICO|nr:alpha-amylase family glycosyl hydrolase [Salana multivorans]ROR93264.1 cyclomaltodextrinase [Salana multivorans]